MRGLIKSRQMSGYIEDVNSECNQRYSEVEWKIDNINKVHG